MMNGPYITNRACLHRYQKVNALYLRRSEAWPLEEAMAREKTELTTKKFLHYMGPGRAQSYLLA